MVRTRVVRLALVETVIGSIGAVLIMGGVLGLLIAASLRAYGLGEPSPKGPIFQVGEGIRRRSGEEAAANYYTNVTRRRERTASRWRKTAQLSAALLVLGVVLFAAK